ncbi:MAG: hypothetical protein IT436_14070 [Phycisphaerales bacterium]|nr:hypothetical protein [Phycisphaerales bacterium]
MYYLNSTTLALLLVMLVFTVSGVRMVKRGVIGRPRFRGYCYECRFDLRDRQAGGVCPECGAVIIAVGQRPAQDWKKRAWLVAQASALLLPWGVVGPTAWRVADMAGLWVWVFPSHYLEAVAGSQDRRTMAATGVVLRRYASGGSSEAAMRRAVWAVARDLERPEWSRGSPGGNMGLKSRTENEIGSGFQGAGPDDLAAALDTPELSAGRFDALLAEVIEAFGKTAVAYSTDVDAMLAVLLAGDRAAIRAWADDKHPVNAPRVLREEQINALAEMVLAVQGDPARPWNPRWGLGLERAYANGRVSEEQIRRYLEQSFAPRMLFYDGSKLPRGDVADFEIVGGWRDGGGRPVRMTAVAKGEFAGRVIGEVTRGQSTSTHDTSLRFDGKVLLPDDTGVKRVTLEVRAEFTPDQIDREMKADHSTYRDQKGRLEGLRTFPAVTVAKEVVAELELVETNAPRIVQDAGGVRAEDLWPRGQKPGVLFRRTPEGVKVGIYEYFQRPAVDLALSCSLRQNGTEYPLGWSFAPRFGGSRLSYGPVVSGIDPGRPVDVVFRSDTGLLERPVWTPRVWKGDAVFEGVLPREDTDGRMGGW